MAMKQTAKVLSSINHFASGGPTGRCSGLGGYPLGVSAAYLAEHDGLLRPVHVGGGAEATRRGAAAEEQRGGQLERELRDGEVAVQSIPIPLTFQFQNQEPNIELDFNKSLCRSSLA